MLSALSDDENKSIFDDETDDEQDDEDLLPVVKMFYDVRDKMNELRAELERKNPRAKVGELHKRMMKMGNSKVRKSLKSGAKVFGAKSYCDIIRIAMIEDIVDWIAAQIQHVRSTGGDDLRTKACAHMSVELMNRLDAIARAEPNSKGGKEDLSMAQLVAYFPLLSSDKNTEPEKAWKFMARYETSEDRSVTVVYTSMIQSIEKEWLTAVIPESAYENDKERLRLELQPRYWRPVFSGHMWSPFQLYHAKEKIWHNLDMRPDSAIYRQFRPIDSCLFDSLTLSILGFGGMQAHRDGKLNFPMGTRVEHRKVVPNMADGRQVVMQLIRSAAEARLEDAVDASARLKNERRQKEPDQEKETSVALFDAIEAPKKSRYEDISDSDEDDFWSSSSSSSSSSEHTVISEDERRAERDVNELRQIIMRLEEKDVPDHVELPPSMIGTIYTLPNKEKARKKFVTAIMELVENAMSIRDKYALKPNVDALANLMSKSRISDDGDDEEIFSSSSSSSSSSNGSVADDKSDAACLDDDE